MKRQLDAFRTNFQGSISGIDLHMALHNSKKPPARKSRGPVKTTTANFIYHLPQASDIPKFSTPLETDNLRKRHQEAGYGIIVFFSVYNMLDSD
jgi:hypothetical protein